MSFGIVGGVLLAGSLLFYSTLEIWLTPNNGSISKDLKKKLMFMLPLFTLSFAIHYFFFVQ
ncbi:hypothetical protein [Bacillus gaemokensis]|uniref:Uncharacterized protein n=1 Tax=Bacillus gaemokensis TaxID=574375 RepID=A0A073KI91_9BACI|nr:hypothetical protein [Bacillus gaemokensis]KEK26290.1 hypothetical protein BAGA_03365 [Bacillus gaemokensis]KYG39096.1 hypothetical protein AZF08_03415 [Bacillus gaemokensis]